MSIEAVTSTIIDLTADENVAIMPVAKDKKAKTKSLIRFMPSRPIKHVKPAFSMKTVDLPATCIYNVYDSKFRPLDVGANRDGDMNVIHIFVNEAIPVEARNTKWGDKIPHHFPDDGEYCTFKHFYRMACDEDVTGEDVLDEEMEANFAERGLRSDAYIRMMICRLDFIGDVDLLLEFDTLQTENMALHAVEAFLRQPADEAYAKIIGWDLDSFNHSLELREADGSTLVRGDALESRFDISSIEKEDGRSDVAFVVLQSYM